MSLQLCTKEIVILGIISPEILSFRSFNSCTNIIYYTISAKIDVDVTNYIISLSGKGFIITLAC